MNFLSRTAIVALAAMSFAACDFLDQEPELSVSDTIIFTDASGAEAAINGAYNRVQGPMDDLVIFGDLAADFAAHTGSFPSWSEIDNHTIPTNNVEVNQQYVAWYALINQANIIIENVEGTPGLTPSRTSAILGESYAMRAFAYHNLVRWFGAVPVTTDAVADLENADLPRVAVDAVYDQILADLDAALPLVSATRSPGFIDADAVRGLKARVLLYDGQFAAAGVLAADVASRFPLVTLSELYESLNSAEAIWELQYTTDDSNSMAFFAFVTGGRFEYGPTPEAAAAYGAGDNRANYAFATNAATSVVGKYFRVTTGADHHFILRGAEMVLIQAEAAARANNAAETIRLVNVVRTRAGATPIATGSVSGVEPLIDLVIAERALELSYEGHRWHDLVRTGRAVSTLPTLSNPQFTLWPIPQRELDINSQLTQNPGY